MSDHTKPDAKFRFNRRKLLNDLSPRTKLGDVVEKLEDRVEELEQKVAQLQQAAQG